MAKKPRRRDRVITLEEWEREQAPEIPRLGITSVAQWVMMARRVNDMGRKFRDRAEWEKYRDAQYAKRRAARRRSGT